MSPIHKSNIVLVGMPGAGKSTVGIILAKLTNRAFVDTDVLIQVSQGRSLQEIVDKEGHLELRRIEEQVIAGLSHTSHVIATGGSAVYSPVAMAHLRKNGVVVFLEVSMLTLENRVTDYASRGLAKRPDQSLADLFAERHALYVKYADLRVPCDTLSHEQVCGKIMKGLLT
jgi:shikimate kinase